MRVGRSAADRIEWGDPLRPGTLRNYQHILQKDFLLHLGNKPASAISRDDVIDVLDVISRRGATRRVDTARAVISSILALG